MFRVWITVWFLTIFGLLPNVALDASDVCSRVLNRVREVRGNPAAFYPNEEPGGVQRRMERIEARIQARSERGWWSGEPFYRTSDIVAGLASGRVILARDRPGIGISTKMEVPYSTPELDRAMDEIYKDFKNALIAQGLDTSNTKLVITSILRSVEQQRSLIASGAPAAGRSSHTYGIAFDISYAWFERNSPQYAQVLEEVLRKYEAAGRINLIKEELQGVWHVAIGPDFFASTHRAESKWPNSTTTQEPAADYGPGAMEFTVVGENGRVDLENGEGFVKYVVVPDAEGGPPEITIHLAYGYKNGPRGWVEKIKNEIFEQFPDSKIISSFSMLNGARALEAIRENPLNPDFSNVPGIRTPARRYEVRFNISNVNGQTNLQELEVVFLPGVPDPGEPLWANRESTLASPIYQRWVSQGAPSSHF